MVDPVNTGMQQPAQMHFPTICAELQQEDVMKNERGGLWCYFWL